ncbi:hypothetical protein SS50377_23569 [Spironucleus salmonicida]|nr:hypothetical protein SS50377_23569 [Spironucleus salmonicida]
MLLSSQYEIKDIEMIDSGCKIFQDRLSDTRAIFNLPQSNNIKRAAALKDLSIQVRMLCMNLNNIKGSGELNCKIIMKQLNKYEEILSNLSGELLKSEIQEKNRQELAKIYYDVPATPIFNIQKVDKDVQIEDQTENIIKELADQRKEYQQIINAFKQSSDEDQKLIDELVDENQKFKASIDKLNKDNSELKSQVEEAEEALAEILSMKK